VQLHHEDLLQAKDPLRDGTAGSIGIEDPSLREDAPGKMKPMPVEAQKQSTSL
jgi:hypothetical protein